MELSQVMVLRAIEIRNWNVSIKENEISFFIIILIERMISYNTAFNLLFLIFFVLDGFGLFIQNKGLISESSFDTYFVDALDK